MVAFSKPVAELPSAIKAVLEPVANNVSSRQPISKVKAITSFAVISLAAYTTNYVYRKRTERAGSSFNNTDVREGPVPGSSKYYLKVPYKNRMSTVTIRPTTAETLKKNKRYFPVLADPQKVGVNKAFFKQLRAILRIIIPRIRSKEVILLVLHSIFLLLRTWLSIVVAKLDGRIVRDLVSANGKEFLKGIVYWFVIAVPAAYTNSMIRFLQSKLSIGFRTRLTRYTHDLYLNKQDAYYKAINLDNRIGGADQFITTDISRFCDGLAALYSNLGKPVLDTIIFNYQLAKSVGTVNMIALFGNYLFTTWLLRKVTPAFGKLSAQEAKLEGDFRTAHSRLIINAEEIAFYHGAELEQSILNRTYTKLIKHINGILKYSFLNGVVEVEETKWKEVRALVEKRGAAQNHLSQTEEFYSLGDVRGDVILDYDGIKFEGAPIVAPNPGNEKGGEELIKNLSLEVRPGEHLLITGPNGVGKTSIARVIARLWPLFKGRLSRPNSEDIFYTPQRPYLSIGTLRDQVIYPYSHADMIRAGRTDEELLEILRVVHLAYIPDREGGWETKKEWKDVFSGGEKQRIGIARVFFHRPKFAILDECTSAVSADVEGLMYQHAKDLGISKCNTISVQIIAFMCITPSLINSSDFIVALITISHRPSLSKYHSHLLRIDEGMCESSTIGTKEERMSMDKEVAMLEAKLKDVEPIKARVAEINKELQLGISTSDSTKIQRRGVVYD
ncbi:16710_t:CDS:10 [Acaulospora morrowiae]|uniref:16710_t:CDS:1 n=1 Tax=Acaulospora morrowiae TaxID=94023 RepID=A0A9N8Z051_9GLOM|nr:16710_t:CDS:10 [Acaulospora morrowiae]